MRLAKCATAARSPVPNANVFRDSVLPTSKTLGSCTRTTPRPFEKMKARSHEQKRDPNAFLNAHPRPPFRSAPATPANIEFFACAAPAAQTSRDQTIFRHRRKSRASSSESHLKNILAPISTVHRLSLFPRPQTKELINFLALRR